MLVVLCCCGGGGGIRGLVVWMVLVVHMVLVAWMVSRAALSVKYMDIAHGNEDDKTPKLSVQRIFAGLYSSTEKVCSANEYCTTNDVRWAHVSSILCCRGGPVD